MNQGKEHSDDAAILLESMTQSILVTTPDLDAPGPYILYVNKAFEKMTGWTRKEVIGKNPRMLQGPKTDLQIFNDLRDKLENGKVWTGRTVNYKKDGSEFYMEWSITPVFDNNGNIYKHLAVQEDITEIVRVEKRLKKSRLLEMKRVEEIEETNIKLQTITEKQKKTLELFTKYVPETIVKKALSKEPGDLRKGKKLDAALLFCDIRGFTPIAETLEPDCVVRILNTYYTLMADVIKTHKGVINQFIGDEIFVSFGAPVPIKNPELSSVNCAIEMVKKLDLINNNLKDILPKEIKVGIGINYGPIVAGNLGSDDRLSYSITGDTVNTAKRIESLTDKHANTILMNESVFEKTGGLVESELWGAIKLKGKTQEINIYQVI